MNFTSLPFAAEGILREAFEFGRIRSNIDWVWPSLALAVIVVFVIYMYIRDAREIHPVLGCLLAGLRLTAFVALLVFYLQPQWRSEEEIVINSRALVLVDTSLSMAQSDAESDDSDTSKLPSRIKKVATALDKTDFLDRLRQVHDVTVLQFSETLDRGRVRVLPKTGSESDSKPTNSATGESADADKPFDWHEFLTADGTETRLGLALRQLINEEGDGPLSGVVVFTDGGQNAGVSTDAAIETARKFKVPIFPVGIGSTELPKNVRISDLIAPARAYPGDKYVVTAYIQAERMANEKVTLELLSRETGSAADKDDPDAGDIEAQQEITLSADGEVLPVKFELTPTEVGRRTLSLRIKNAPDDSNPADNRREVDVEIVDHKNRVMLLAGGPMREYRFLRNQLHRDDSAVVHVLLQSAREGISQDADKLLDDFPLTREEMFDYDCIIGFDPDWQALNETQINLLEMWVAEQGGGLILVAGPVYTGRMVGGWVEDPAMAKIRALYPVQFFERMFLNDDGMYIAKDPCPLLFTREGMDARHLWLDDQAGASRAAWDQFSGVFSYCPVRGPKPAATVLARFDENRDTDDAPVFLAEHFYGSGRVFYIGSGEMWRLRRDDDAYFERLYTKLIRHVSQGRLLRGSSRGVLLVGQDRYVVGKTVEVRAQLTDSRLDPLSLAEVSMQLFAPDGSVQTITLQALSDRPGTFTGRFTVLVEGDYRLELPIPDSEDERLSRRISVKIPDLERENPQQNKPLLDRLGKRTGGAYYDGLAAALAATPEAIAAQLKDRTTTTVIQLPPDKDRERDWLMWMMITICSLLCVEWLIRRLSKLA